MKLYVIYSTLVDVFLDEGWKNWSRVSLKHGRVVVVAGAQLSDNVLNEIKRRMG